MDPVAVWKSLGGKKPLAEDELKAFLTLDNKTLAESLLKAVFMPIDVAQTKQILNGLAWGLPREMDRVRENIEKPVEVQTEASEGFEDMAIDEEEATFAGRANQELTIFRGMISQRLKMLSSGAIDELRPVLEKRS